MRLIERSKFRWALPGLKIKRYILLSGVGLVLLFYGIGVIYFNLIDTGTTLIKKFFLIGVKMNVPYEDLVLTVGGGLLLVLAVAMITIGIKKLVVSIAFCLAPDKSEEEIMDTVFEKRKENLKKKIVVIGGGTGTTSVLEGLKEKFVKISAVITVADTGGSSGRLRREMNIPPPGDIRNCLVSLAKENSLSAKLLSYRFQEEDSCLNGHNLGNIIIAGLTKIKGDFGDAVIELSHLLQIDGETMPFTTEDVTICAEFDNGAIVKGEADITNYRGKIKRVFIEPDDAKPYLRALERISEANVIVFGPGSLFTSVIPPILFTSVTDTIRRSKAKKVFVVNIMTEQGETDGFAASDHIKAIEEVIGKGTIDYAVVNTGEISKSVLSKYEYARSFPVVADCDNIRKMGIKCVKGNLATERGDTIRHNSEKLGEVIFRIAKGKV